ncbi:Gfo/Idh/MocA family oxidoreductase [Prosthecobacter sp.]|uniref:Gfo/Idh/MocA family oxidoreductase n=1 Tax=Prosthecobacter sp. TaxID=1965333 RepID=UPI0024876554|nr:Gfo/Idh/MocA family oxidoreductase [Prosthecobacter sp.]MDI1311674.1 Gfo/Idh/MocA family oxidoreductase [Prosthecobacter sp.]
MRFGILGGGFGMYGYLPAIAGLDPSRIVTLEKYRPTIRSRPELASLANRISVVSNPAKISNDCDLLVVSKRPSDQEQLVDAALASGWGGTLVLEKPLARTPSAAELMLEKLATAKMRLVVGFTIAETDWVERLSSEFQLHRPTSIHFDWRFMAHHYKHGLYNWKRNVSEGGGALRFYAVHLLEVLARMANWSSLACSPLGFTDEDPSLTCSLHSTHGRAEINCDSQWTSSPFFSVTLKMGDQILFRHDAPTPFSNSANDSTNQPGRADSRIIFIRQLLRRAIGGALSDASIHQEHVRLWGDLEKLRLAKVSHIEAK